MTLSTKWGPFTVDRFASESNAKLKRYNSKFYFQSSEAVDAFSQSWENERNFLVPPIREIVRVVKKIQREKIHGVLVVPFWPSSEFWPFLIKDGSFGDFIKDPEIFRDGKRFVQAGQSNMGLLGSDGFSGALLAMNIRS